MQPPLGPRKLASVALGTACRAVRGAFSIRPTPNITSIRDMKRIYIEKMPNDLDRFIRAEIEKELRGRLTVGPGQGGGRRSDDGNRRPDHGPVSRVARQRHWSGLGYRSHGDCGLVVVRGRRSQPYLGTCQTRRTPKSRRTSGQQSEESAPVASPAATSALLHSRCSGFRPEFPQPQGDFAMGNLPRRRRTHRVGKNR